MKTDSEQWKDIQGYEGIYQVSNHGRIKSKARIVRSTSGVGKGSKRTYPERIMAQHRVGSGGYLAVALYKGDGGSTKTVHRLVFEAFVSNPLGLPEVNHKDGNKDNNHYSNLEPATRMQNCRHAVESGLMKIRGEDNYFTKLTEKDVRLIREMHSCGTTQTEIAKKTGFQLANIHCIVRRKSWKHI